MKLNKIDEVWNSANPLFKWCFGLCQLEILLRWQRDITTSSLLGSGKVGVLFYIHVPYQPHQQLCVLVLLYPVINISISIQIVD